MISVILAAYKEPEQVIKAIKVIKNQLKQKNEILVFCPDKETAVAAESISGVNAFDDLGRHEFKEKLGKPAALNQAFKIAKGDILILTDGDVFISDNAISPLLEKFKDHKIGAVSGNPISINDKKTMFGFWSYILSDTAHKRRLRALKLGRRMFCSGYLYAFRNGIIKKIPAETLSEDGLISHLIYSKGYKIAYSPESRVYVKYPDNFRDWIKQKKRSAGGYNQIKKWIGQEIRSFRKESLGVLDILKYASNFRELYYILMLIFARLYLWIVIFIDINIKKKEFKQIWVRIDSTK